MKTRAVVITGKGGIEALSVGETTLREPGAGELSVRVSAAGLNRADVLQRRGFYPAPPGAPRDVPGLEYAGTVETIGPSVSAFAVGDRVMGIVAGGGMAEHVIVHEREAIAVPGRLSLAEAAAIPEVFLTAFDALFVQAGLELGETVLVHAVGSGIGTAAVQLARASSASSLGTARTADKLERAKLYGLEHGIVVSDQGFARAVLEATQGRGADMILDTVGAAYLAENLAALAPGGRIVTIGLLGGATAELALGLLLAKRARIIGSVLRSRTLEEKASLAQAFSRLALPLLVRGVLNPVIDCVMPMHEIRAAHTRMESNATFGKIVLQWA